jgi:NAD(P)-dependent dehydrogenase (short-subunit alcohol dehydrogenase family)
VSSLAGYVANEPLAAYATTKFGVLGLSEDPAMRPQMVAAYQRRNYGPERVASNILKAIGRNRAVAPISAEAWAMYYVKRFAPWLVRWLNARLGERGRRRSAPSR